MKKTIIYGIGARYNYYFAHNRQYVNLLRDMEIIGIADGNKENTSKKIHIGKREYIVKNRDELKQITYDSLLITSKKYYEDIKAELVSDGHNSDKFDLLENAISNRVYHTEFFNGREGVEIGGPSGIFANIYDCCSSCDGINFSKDTVWWQASEDSVYTFGNMKLGKIYIADAVDMRSISNERYDFLLSSNNLEHIANPLRALKEFYRVMKCGGYLLIAVPIKTYTFDHNREFTTFEHILEDYDNNVTEMDLSHLDEIIEKHDYDLDPECGGRETFIERSQMNSENRCLHHHVFDESCLREMFAYIGIEVIDFNEFEKCYVIVGKKPEEIFL